MKQQEQKEFDAILSAYIHHPEVLKMKQFIAHGKVNVFSHSMNVARMAYLLNQRLRLNADLSILLPGALLHDFYLYDWHNASLKKNLFEMHGFTHPGIACANAERFFTVSEPVKEVICCHMWPLTFKAFPKHREAVLVCLSDKICALKETIFR